MKKSLYIVLGLLVSITLHMQARTFVAGEDIYVNAQQDFDWSKDGAKLYLYLFNSTGNMWLDLTQENGKLYRGTFTSNCSYNQAIVVRKNPANASHDWTGVWTQTGDLDVVDDWNCIDNFNDAGNRWKMYSPSLDKISSYTASLTAEVIAVCPSTDNIPLSLKAKLNSTKTAYAYGNVHGHAWYTSTDSNPWTSLDGYRGLVRSGEELIDTIITLPNPIPANGIYYYLHSSNPAGRRLIHVVPQTTGCDLDCEITSFETAISAVNADDNTYTLDGMVAFGVANGSLVITCDGVSVSIDDAHSPQSFSLHGVPAATISGQKTKAYAYFTGNGACRDSIEVDVPNATEAVDVQTRDSLTERTITLTPKDYDPANNYVWLADGDTIKGAPQVLTLSAFHSDTTITYTYKEYYPAAGDMDDMMNNGGYEDPSMDYGSYGQVSTISDYNFWGRFPQTAGTQINFYTDTLPSGVNPDKLNRNGFAVVQNANNFWHSYAPVKPKEGANFALFDAETGAAGGNKKAWYATSANNPKLKLQKGTTYVLSFWAANINNYGEMDNAARFVFRIEYNGHVWNSDTLDLSKPEFRNNRWHQHSETFYADEDCNNVTISVVNLNTNTLNIGNDFALDDIQFHPISSVSKVVKSQQQFVVTAHEPKIKAFTVTPQPISCGGNSFVVKMHVEYENPDGQLIIRDATDNTDYPYTVSAPFDTPKTLDEDLTINMPTAALHNWEVFFENAPTVSQTTTTNSPVVPLIDTAHIALSELSCTDRTTTLTFDLDYTYQRGTLTYWVDALPKQTATYSVDDPTKQTLTGLTVPNIPADGRAHKLYVSFSGANSCIKSYTLPYAPMTSVISSFVVTKDNETVLCDADSFTVTITATIPYALSRPAFFTLPIPGGPIITSSIAGEGKKSFTWKNIPVPMCDTAMIFTIRIMEISGMHACPVSDTIDMPTRMSCNKLDTAICEGEIVTWMGNTYTGHVGQTDTFAIGYDSLFLTVRALPEITVAPMAMTCDDEANILIPFTVVSGAPDIFDIAVGSNHYTGTVVGSDISFTRATELVAGDYTATVTVGETGINCTSQVNVNFTIALGNSLLSKWTDVLFVNNASGRFVSYQWYKNGAEMSGETLQRLYDPSGLSGTTDEYMCRMSTTDGQTLYTCPITFDEVTPSRTQTTGGEAKVIEILDTMGRPVSGKLGRGIYIIVTEQDGQRTSNKLFIYE